jgi:hypothetical protein
VIGFQDYAKVREYQQAAAGGNGDAMNNLGLLYKNGLGVAQDYGKARWWFQKGADAGNAYAMENLGWLYQYGLGGAKNYGTARHWYQKAANTDAKH